MVKWIKLVNGDFLNVDSIERFCVSESVCLPIKSFHVFAVPKDRPSYDHNARLMRFETEMEARAWMDHFMEGLNG